VIKRPSGRKDKEEQICSQAIADKNLDRWPSAKGGSWRTISPQGTAKPVIQGVRHKKAMGRKGRTFRCKFLDVGRYKRFEINRRAPGKQGLWCMKGAGKRQQQRRRDSQKAFDESPLNEEIEEV